MDNCIFCKIVAGEIPASKVYEDDKYIAFLDINPINFGHTLIIPREHYSNFLETPEHFIHGMTSLAKKIAPAITKVTSAKAFNFVINNGEESGQIVHHVHLHIIPRFKNDGQWPNPLRLNYAEGQMAETAEKIKTHLAS